MPSGLLLQQVVCDSPDVLRRDNSHHTGCALHGGVPLEVEGQVRLALMHKRRGQLHTPRVSCDSTADLLCFKSDRWAKLRRWTGTIS